MVKKKKGDSSKGSSVHIGKAPSLNVVLQRILLVVKRWSCGVFKDRDITGQFGQSMQMSKMEWCRLELKTKALKLVLCIQI